MAGDYQRSVFLNCPFDALFSPLMQAIVFTVVDCGFIPRCALERSDASEIRIQKIYRIIGECRLGIHDLSRTQLDPVTSLPRFNMPLELGIFLGAKFLAGAHQNEKACLVFDEEPHRYRMYLSDVAGQDVDWHGNDAKNVVRKVRDWLASMSEGSNPSGSIVWDHYLTFQGELIQTCSAAKQRVDELTYNDLLRHIIGFRANYKEQLSIRGQEQTVHNPSTVDIKRAIESITPREDDPFLILGKGGNGQTYIQAFMEPNALWIVEFRDGHDSKHFRASKRLKTSEVIALFLSYANAEDSWRNAVQWKQTDL